MRKTASPKSKRSSVQVLHPSATDGVSSPDAEALHRVRDLLFGETTREQSAQLDTLSDEIHAQVTVLRRELRDEAAALREEIRAEMEAVRAAHADFERAKLGRKDLRELLSGVVDELGK